MSTDNALVERLILPMRQKECQISCLKSTFKIGRQNRLKCGLLWSVKLPPLLGGGLEPPRLSAYAPQTYVSAISPPERFRGTQLVSCRRLPASDLSSISTADGQSGAVSPPVASNQSAICLTIRSTRPSVTSTTNFGRI